MSLSHSENRVPTPLSERMRAWPREDGEGGLFIDYVDGLADEVAVLEDAFDRLTKLAGYWEGLIHEATEPTTEVEEDRVARLKQGYEKLGLTSALQTDNKYGKHSAFGYQRNAPHPTTKRGSK